MGIPEQIFDDIIVNMIYGGASKLVKEELVSYMNSMANALLDMAPGKNFTGGYARGSYGGTIQAQWTGSNGSFSWNNGFVMWFVD